MENNFDLKFIKLQQLLKETNKLLIQTFKQKYKTAYKNDWQDLPQFGQKFFLNHKFESNFNRTQKDLIKAGNSFEWDISLLICILKFKIFYDKKLTQILEEIRSIRNNQAHNSNFEITEEEYNKKLMKLKEIIEFLGGDASRINLIVSQRNSISRMESLDKSYKFLSLPKYNIDKPKIDNSHNSLKTKKVYFREMNSQKDYVLQGKELHGVNIDISIIPMIKSNAYMMIIQDENLDIQRLADYNHNASYNIDQIFSFGAKFIIYNPYHRLAADGKPMIRVDDPSNIKVLGYYPQSCRTCHGKNCNIMCSNCKGAYYCSKECQSNDKNKLQHDLICRIILKDSNSSKISNFDNSTNITTSRDSKRNCDKKIRGEKNNVSVNLENENNPTSELNDTKDGNTKKDDIHESFNLSEKFKKHFDFFLSILDFLLYI